MFINVKTFGVKGENKFFDTLGMQRALNYAKKHPGTRLYVPDGVYHIAKALVIYGNTTLQLSKNAVLERHGKDALLKNGQPYKFYHGYEGNSHIYISGGTFDMNGEDYPYNNTALCIGHARDIQIKNVTFKDIVGGHAIDACGIDGLHLSHCNFKGFLDYEDSRWFSEAVQLDIQVPGAFPKFSTWDGTITKNVVIEHCYFGNSETPGMKPWNRAIGSHASRYDKFYENIHIRHNYFDQIQAYAITLLKNKNTYLHHNYFHECCGGIRYLGVDRGKNSADMKGQVQSVQAGENLNIWKNVFIGKMDNPAILIKSYEGVPHNQVLIAENQFENIHQQRLYLKDISNLTLKCPNNLSVKQVNTQ
ncbi:glycoside hydrolase family 55 protein [Staphylococcus sp. SQ8-PEA]|uniref:Glycoside hydrolase family 55 protein n=1 Tax=Staphylococcus marylandisciuri TaxID=2981529 RepID=A0ABT2QQE4_9STAP|nr:glycoside hydrolase family 55 protein [Staphylococcus marylandisciuri]MCU5746190.1 glycoside hydrolase family 55 protein [Staphylococcus marylandisciuri]